MGVLGGKIGEGVVRYWLPTNSFFLFGVLTSVPILVKIDQERRPWRTDTHTQTQTDFIICPMLYAIAMGQIITPSVLSAISKLSRNKTTPKCCTNTDIHWYGKFNSLALLKMLVIFSTKVTQEKACWRVNLNTSKVSSAATGSKKISPSKSDYNHDDNCYYYCVRAFCILPFI